MDSGIWSLVFSFSEIHHQVLLFDVMLKLKCFSLPLWWTTYLSHSFVPVSLLMSGPMMPTLEEPLDGEKFPCSSFIGRPQRSAFDAFWPRVSETVDHHFIEGQQCSSSNSFQWVLQNVAVGHYLIEHCLDILNPIALC